MSGVVTLRRPDLGSGDYELPAPCPRCGQSLWSIVVRSTSRDVITVDGIPMRFPRVSPPRRTVVADGTLHRDACVGCSREGGG
jgi:hypothetical protein